MTFVIERSWDGGPLREFANIRPKSGWGIPYHGKSLYANQYICDLCSKRVGGLYRAVERVTIGSQNPPFTKAAVEVTTWSCSACRPKSKTKQPEHLKAYQKSQKAKEC